MTDHDKSIYMLPRVRCSFLHLEKPHAPPNSSEARYSADFLLNMSEPVHVETWNGLYELIQELAAEKWQDVAPAVLNQINTDPKLRGFGNGDSRVKKSTMQVLDGYAGHVYVSAKSTNPPDIVGQDGKVIDPANTFQKAKKPYAGCYVNALIRVWLQDNQYGRAVRFDLVGVQFAEDGQAFGPGQVDTQQYFKPIPGAPPPVSAPGQQATAPGQQAPAPAMFGEQPAPGGTTPPWQ